MAHDNSQQDRRRYPRHRITKPLSVELRVGMSGTNPAILLTCGRVTDISCGGVKCDIGLDVPVGTHVDVRFADAPVGALIPAFMEGEVVRTESAGGAPEKIAIAFARPLARLDVAQLQAGAPRRVRIPANRPSTWSEEGPGLPPFATSRP